MSRVNRWTILAVALLAICVSPSAWAAQYILNVDYCTTGCLMGGTGGTVDVTATSQTIGGVTFNTDILVTLNSGFSYDDAGLTTFSFNNTSTALTAANFDVLTTAWGTPFVFQKPSTNADGAGNFQYGFSCSPPMGTHCQNTTETFELLSTATVASFNVLSTGGSPSAFFAVNVNNPTNGACTGVIGADGNSTPERGGSNNGTGVCATVPEPNSIAFFATGLLGLGFVLRKKFASKALIGV